MRALLVGIHFVSRFKLSTSIVFPSWSRGATLMSISCAFFSEVESLIAWCKCHHFSSGIVWLSKGALSAGSEIITSNKLTHLRCHSGALYSEYEWSKMCLILVFAPANRLCSFKKIRVRGIFYFFTEMLNSADIVSFNLPWSSKTISHLHKSTTEATSRSF